MAGSLSVTFVNLADNSTVTTPANPPYFQIAVDWINPKSVDGTVTLTGTNGVVVTPTSGYTATKMGKGSCSFSLQSASSVAGVTFTAKIEAPIPPPNSSEKQVSGVTVNVSA